jgi:steroid delta-isomerase-like uncharacterized protein
MSVEQNKATVRRYFERLLNGWDLGITDEIFAPDFVFHGNILASPPARPLGREAYKREVLATLSMGFPERQYAIEDLVAEGDRVVVRWTASGTHLGEFQGIPATGKRVTKAGISLFRLAGGRVVEYWVSTEERSELRQIGVPLGPGAPGS